MSPASEGTMGWDTRAFLDPSNNITDYAVLAGEGGCKACDIHTIIEG